MSTDDDEENHDGSEWHTHRRCNFLTVALDDKGLSVIELDMYGETADVIKPFMTKWNMNYPVAIGTDAIGDQFGLKEMPLTLLIDRDGKIAVSHAGIVHKTAFEEDIQKLLQ